MPLTQCDASVGYRGFITVGGSTLPFLSGGFEHIQETIKSQPLINDTTGAGRSIYNYTLSKSYYLGKLACEVFSSGGYGQAFRNLLTLAIGSSGKSCNSFTGSGGNNLVFSPNGGDVFSVPGTGRAVVNGFTIRGNPGGLVQADFSFWSTNIGSGGASGSVLQFESSPHTEDANPLPYYNSSFLVQGTGDDTLINNYLTDWSITLSAPVIPIYTLCNPNNATQNIEANDLRLGFTDITGSFSYFRPAGTVFGTGLANGCTISIGLIGSILNLPNVVFVNDTVPNSGPNQAVYRKIQFESFGLNGQSSISLV